MQNVILFKHNLLLTPTFKIMLIHLALVKSGLFVENKV